MKNIAAIFILGLVLASCAPTVTTTEQAPVGIISTNVGTLVGACLVGILENGLVMLSVPYYSLNIIKGLVLALALATTYYRFRKK